MRLKKLLGCSLAVTMALSNVMGASAATLRDVFDADYYVSMYPDVKAALGEDEEVLWNHFITCGVKEGRSMNSLLDVVKYREKYTDLAEAFGDNWDAYLNHYLNSGAWEGRDSGTDFDAVDYLAKHADLQETFGKDLLAVWNYYQTGDVPEDSKAGSGEDEAAEKEAGIAPVVRREREDHSGGSWSILGYDSAGNLVEDIGYLADGSVAYRNEYKYDSAGNKEMTQYLGDDGRLNMWERYERYEGEYGGYFFRLMENIHYNADGSVWYRHEYEYVSARNRIKSIDYYYNADGSVRQWTEHEYDSAGKEIKSIHYNADGSVWQWIEYERDGNRTKSTYYDGDGNVTKSESHTTW